MTRATTPGWRRTPAERVIMSCASVRRRFAELLPRLIWHHDLPLNFANSVHIFAVSELARQHVTVVLTGEGADELFGGYPRYSIPRITELLSFAPGPLRQPLAALLEHMPDHRMRRVGAVLRRPLDDSLLFNSTGIDTASVERLLGRPQGDSPLTVRRQLVAAARRAHSRRVWGRCPTRLRDLSRFHPESPGQDEHGYEPGGSRALPGQ